MHYLYITARAGPSVSTVLLLQKSPRALLDCFVGFTDTVDAQAPEWTKWKHPILEFQQPKATFAELFTRMATWEVNKDVVCQLYT
jgi:hypothetical protein